ncbi:MAG: TonB family protein [Bacteroidales bacterium]|nr:TonB family protein [Bacteroidales bacterium]
MNKKPNISESSDCIAEDVLLKYLNNELSDTECLAVENHIKSCEVCSDFLDGLLLMDNPNDIAIISTELNQKIDSFIKPKRKVLGMPLSTFRAIAAVFLVLTISGTYVLIDNIINSGQIDQVKEISELELEQSQEIEEVKSLENQTRVADANRPGKTTVSKDKNETIDLKTDISIKEKSPEETIEEEYIDIIHIYDQADEIDVNSLIEEQDRFYAESASNTGGSTNMNFGFNENISENNREEPILENEIGDKTTPVSTSGSSRNNLFKKPDSEQKINRAAKKSESSVTANEESITTAGIAQEQNTIVENNEIIESINWQDEKIINSDAEIIYLDDNPDNDEIEPIAFMNVEEKPQFPGGDAEMLKYINENFTIPPQAKELAIEGTVYVQFVIDRSGKTKDAEIKKGLDPEIDAEALRVVKEMPLWSPGRQRGAPVEVYFIIPIKIRFQ